MSRYALVAESWRALQRLGLESKRVGNRRWPENLHNRQPYPCPSDQVAVALFRAWHPEAFV